MATQRASYWQLMQYLEQLPINAAETTLSLPTLEQVMGGPLPSSATSPSFWAAGIVAEATWKRSGFTASLDAVACAVTFRRQSCAPHSFEGVTAQSNASEQRLVQRASG